MYTLLDNMLRLRRALFARCPLPSIGALPVIYNIAVGMSVRAEMFVHLYRHSIALLLRSVRQLCCRELPAVCDQ